MNHKSSAKKNLCVAFACVSILIYMYIFIDGEKEYAHMYIQKATSISVSPCRLEHAWDEITHRLFSTFRIHS